MQKYQEAKMEIIDVEAENVIITSAPGEDIETRERE